MTKLKTDISEREKESYWTTCVLLTSEQEENKANSRSCEEEKTKGNIGSKEGNQKRTNIDRIDKQTNKQKS